MPLYEYECAKDGRFELIRKFSDPPVSVCPTCGHKVEKLFSSPAFQFKGTGWYVTDYAKKDNGSSKESKEAKESKESSKDSAPSESSSSSASDKSDKSAKPDSSPKTTPSPKDAASSSSSSK